MNVTVTVNVRPRSLLSRFVEKNGFQVHIYVNVLLIITTLFVCVPAYSVLVAPTGFSISAVNFVTGLVRMAQIRPVANVI